MGLFSNVGKFFAKDLPRAVGNVVTKEIPKFFTKTLPKVVQKETYAPDLPPLRGEVARNKTLLDQRSAQFFRIRNELEETRAEYERVTEDFRARVGELAGRTKTGDLPDDSWIEIPKTDVGKVLKDTENSVRYVLKFFTLNVTELIWMPGEIAKERAHLKKQKSALKAANGKLARAIGDMKNAKQELAERTASMRAKFAEAGIDDLGAGASALQAAASEDEARIAMAQRMIADGVPLADIAFVTGLPEADLSGLTPEIAEIEEPGDLAADLRRDGLNDDEIAELGVKPV